MSFNAIIAFIGFIRGYTKGGIDVDEDILDTTYKIMGDFLLIKSSNGVYAWKFGPIGRNIEKVR